MVVTHIMNKLIIDKQRDNTGPPNLDPSRPERIEAQDRLLFGSHETSPII